MQIADHDPARSRIARFEARTQAISRDRITRCIGRCCGNIGIAAAIVGIIAVIASEMARIDSPLAGAILLGCSIGLLLIAGTLLLAASFIWISAIRADGAADAAKPEKGQTEP